MRTTLTLDDDVAAKLKDLARRRKLTFKEAVNAVLRHGLVAQQPGSRAAPRVRLTTFDSPLRTGVDPLRLNALVDDLEVSDTLPLPQR